MRQIEKRKKIANHITHEDLNDNTLSTIEGPIQFVKVGEENLVEVLELLKRKKLVPAVYDPNQAGITYI